MIDQSDQPTPDQPTPNNEPIPDLGFEELENLLATVKNAVEAKAQSSLRASAKHSASAQSAASARTLGSALVGSTPIWQDVANVAMFITQHCEYCGSTTEFFSTYMTRQLPVFSRPHSGEHWVRAESINPKLPYEKMVREESTPICSCCLVEQGWVGEPRVGR